MKKFLVLIIIFGGLLRFYDLGSMPPSLNWDEVSHGYNAFSLAKTGKDEWGKTMPIIFRAYGDYKLPVYIYLTALSELFFGMNAFAVRFTSAFFGTMLIVVTYLLIQELFFEKKNKEIIGVIAAGLVAIEPWSFFISRAALEANVGQAFAVIGMVFLLAGLRRKKISFLNIGLLFEGFSVWTYNSMRIFVPLMILGFLIIFRRELKKLYRNSQKILLSGILGLVFFGVMFVQLAMPEGGARYGWLSIINDSVIGEIINSRNACGYSENFCRIIYNRPVYFVQKFTNNYLAHFNPNFLYIKGGKHYQFSVPDFGLLYVSGVGFLLVGLISLLWEIDKKKLLMIIWIMLAPIASSLTKEGAHALRFVTILPIPMTLTASGAVFLWEKVKDKGKYFIFGIYTILMFMQFGNYLRQYFNDYKTKYGWAWQYGNEAMVNYVKANYDNYDSFIITKDLGEVHEFVLFYWPWSPEDYQSNSDVNRFYQTNWYWVDSFDKFYFINEWDIERENDYNSEFYLESGEYVDCRYKKCLLITNKGNVPANWTYKDKIVGLDGNIIYEIYKE